MASRSACTKACESRTTSSTRVIAVWKAFVACNQRYQTRKQISTASGCTVSTLVEQALPISPTNASQLSFSSVSQVENMLVIVEVVDRSSLLREVIACDSTPSLVRIPSADSVSFCSWVVMVLEYCENAYVDDEPSEGNDSTPIKFIPAAPPSVAVTLRASYCPYDGCGLWRK